ncbi:tRNA lysidine(34) synthetase TilS [Saccharibacter sp. EH70]|uniref:tRNA lysidine(34) synthetase TilS n=1 Tax=Saccharibacter sp. EH70 TaxID=2689392 RepID=UPI00132AC90B|nr:tRNA lysidine(34) synthetase TilS [Saccharibacter sp. EH70]MXV35203.1 tRNA lysidine(34) synthetase TilS [Saccharibacter sp. EH611]MXV57250.1 tRNA lysidine(34) synthetase TilS [Saccharibacter sp. EH70]MXV64889.1 tRNA lysidine(34) synthetase TilS [Saccharibacter sp. EH60]
MHQSALKRPKKFSVHVQPVSENEFLALIEPLGPFPPDCPETPVMLAVSGGADSMALAVMARRWRRYVMALVVDHGLRSESQAEAQQTCARLAALDVPSQLVTLRTLPTGSTQERARIARFQCLESACVQAGGSVLLVAHHAADQEETVMMRQERASGFAGLCGMAPRAVRERIAVVRPLLSVRPERLRATLRAAGVNWCEDPSNHKRHYRRVQTRQDMTSSQREEMTALNGQALAHQKKRDQQVSQWLAEQAVWHPEGWVTLNRSAWEMMNKDGMLDGLARLIKLIGGRLYEANREAVQRLWQQGCGTLSGVRVTWREAHQDIVLLRERRGIAAGVAAQTGQRWDGRWRYLGPDQISCQIAALGKATCFLRQGREVPAAVLQTVPALWCEGEVIAVPEEARGLDGRIPRCSFVWESGVPATGERSFG